MGNIKKRYIGTNCCHFEAQMWKTRLFGDVPAICCAGVNGCDSTFSHRKHDFLKSIMHYSTTSVVHVGLHTRACTHVRSSNKMNFRIHVGPYISSSFQMSQRSLILKLRRVPIGLLMKGRLCALFQIFLTFVMSKKTQVINTGTDVSNKPSNIHWYE
jgi:hypothetical protein